MSKELEFLDLVNLMGFALNIANYQENMNQSDKQDIMRKTDSQTQAILSEVHHHLQEQDKKLDYIISRLEELK